MSFPFNAYLLALAGSFFGTLVALPLWRRWCVGTGLVDDPGHRKIHATPVPLAGGIAVLTGILLPLVFGAVALELQWFGAEAGGPLSYGLSRRTGQLGAVLLGALGMVCLGWFDDKYELRARVKFTGQLLIALLVAGSGIRITLFVHNPLFSYAITLLWILTVTNAFNFMDNMNGLCAGLGIIGGWYCALTAAVQGQYLVTILALLTCGALLGFLPYNFPKASTFLGDSGSHLVGFMMSVLAILPNFYTPDRANPLAVLGPLLILAVPLADLVWVVILRWRKGQPFYLGDTNHLSHRLVRRGHSKPQAVLLIWLIAAAVGALSFWW